MKYSQTKKTIELYRRGRPFWLEKSIINEISKTYMLIGLKDNEC